MATVIINEERLSAIGDAIRAKTGGTELIPVVEMPAEIAAIVSGGGGGDTPPEKAFAFTGTCFYVNYGGWWDWFFEEYADRITFRDVTGLTDAFHDSKLTSIPFEFHISEYSTRGIVATNMFNGCTNLTHIGKFTNFIPSEIMGFFRNCYNLRELPEFVNPDFSVLHTKGWYNAGYMFDGCRSLRSVPEDLLKELYTAAYSSSSSNTYYYFFLDCYALDELRGFPVITVDLTNNMFVKTFENCGRVKEVIFDTDNGTPKKVNWKNQTVDLSSGVGYVLWADLKQCNSGITEDKCLDSWDDAVKYNSLKNDPDWTSCCYEYSRYNHDSAVNTINSLPDCSSSGGTNTIKFRGEVGSKTDGGAINTLTAEEIAVAAVKGWTVTFV